MFKFVLSCVVGLAAFTVTANSQSFAAMPVVENLVNLTEIQMKNDIRFYEIQSSLLLSSFNEKLEVVQFVQNSTELKYRDTTDTLNRMVVPSNRSRACVVAHRSLISPLATVQDSINDCIASANTFASSLLVQANFKIAAAQNVIPVIRASGISCIRYYSGNTDAAVQCTETNIETQNETLQVLLNGVAIELEKASSDALFYAKRAQQCVYLVVQNSNVNIEQTFAKVKNCAKSNDTIVLANPLRALLTSLYNQV